MPRRPRVYVPGFSSHVYQRGHNCCAVFHDERDHEHFLLLVRQAALDNGVNIHAYALMKTHYHLLATPASRMGLPTAMKDIDGGPSVFFAKRENVIGVIFAPIVRDRAGLANVQAAPDDEQAIGFGDQRVGDAVVTAKQAGGQWAGAGDGALAAHGVGDGDAVIRGEAEQGVIGGGDVHAAAGKYQRALRLGEECGGFFGVGCVRAGAA